MASLLSQLWTDFSQLWTVPKDTTQTLTPSQFEADANKAIPGFDSLLKDIEAVWTDTGVQAKIMAAVQAGIQADQLVSIVYAPATVALVPLEILQIGLPFIFSIINVKLVKVTNPASGVSYVPASWASNPREQLNPDGSFKY